MESFEHQERRRNARRSSRSSRTHRSSRSSWTAEEQRREQERVARQQEREARRLARTPRGSSKSIGADTLAMPSAQVRGYAGRNAERPYGRGETVHAAERARKGTYEVLSPSARARAEAEWTSQTSQANADARTRAGITARPAVYTQEAPRQGLLERLGLKKTQAQGSLPRRSRTDAGFSNGSSYTGGASDGPSYEARPAVYTQKASRKGAGIASRLHLPSLDSLPHIPIPVLIAAFVVFALFFLYGPACTYYAAWREAGRLNAEYQVLVEQNTELNDELSRLQSLEGIEDEARKRGYAYPNEEALVVEGLDEATLADPALVDAAVAEHEENLPWYVRVLDSVLSYESQ